VSSGQELDNNYSVTVSSETKPRSEYNTRCDIADDQKLVLSAQKILIRPSRNRMPRKMSASATVLSSYAFLKSVLPRRFRCCLFCFFSTASPVEMRGLVVRSIAIVY
jgi:hypothetical protein